jgi:hypothetical protein
MNKQHTITAGFRGKRQRSSFARAKTQFRGISAAAKTLGCSRFHLWEVLKGRRHSPVLESRYNRLKGASK